MYLYVSGGQLNNGSGLCHKLRSVERLNLSLKKWEKVVPMNVARSNHSSCSLDDSVYVFCGLGNEGWCTPPMNSIEKLAISKAGSIEIWLQRW